MAMNAAVITVPAFASARDGVRHFFGTRSQADSLALDVGVPARQSGAQGCGWLLSVKQVHGTDALVVDRPLTESDQFPGGWDALVTDQPGVTVAVRTADCVPVLVHDPHRHVVAAIHVGWRGAVAGVVSKTLMLMATRFGSTRSDLRVYQGHKARLDLKALIRRQMEGEGVSSSSVSSVNLCTICHDQLFYSYRREGRVNGTMVSGIALLSHR